MGDRGRAPRGARELKLPTARVLAITPGRAPRGARELKPGLHIEVKRVERGAPRVGRVS